ncbi:MFS transporter [Rhodococcus erythropolis]|uniref:MFS transporter n=1 Tax=Rhodococcus erythropolis TaxID=1833 RepID=UPI000878F3F0|nr:MFS transporter [Rhodococcus erythropolis]OFV76441.1 putative tartrate transporter [Rhodococcus erythropolis]
MPTVVPGEALERLYKAATRKVWFRLVPVLVFAYLLNYLDRTNIALAKTQLGVDLGISAAAFGLGAGIFFLAYCLLEIPSNLLLHRFGARRWISRIVISWGAISTLTMFVQGETSFYIMRFLLGVAEAGFYPGMLFYFTLWFAARDRAVAVGILLIAPNAATVFGSPLGGALMTLDGTLGLQGWQWLLLLEGLPTVAFGVFLWFYLPNGPADARWLTGNEKQALITTVEASAPSEERNHSVATALKSVFTSGVLLSIGVIYFVTQFSVYGITFFMPSIVESFGVSGSLAIGAISGLPAVGALIGVVVYPRLFRTYGRPLVFVAIAMSVAAIAALIAANSAPAVSLLTLAVMQFFLIGTTPVLWSLAMGRISGVQSAAGLALINSIGLLGGFFGPNVFGIAESRTGDPSSAIALLTIAAIVALGVAGLLGYLLRRNPAPAEPVPGDHNDTPVTTVPAGTGTNQ